jgi:glycosyltransferase involved in cell wall biosynthesis
MVQNKETKDPSVIKAGKGFAKYFNFVRPYIDFAIPLPQIRKRILFSTSLLPDQFIKSVASVKPDVIHLNWIAGGMIKIESLAEIRQPIIWTFHDLWAFTGGCHNQLECNRYHNNCGCCPLLHSKHENDLSRKVFNRKQGTYGKIKNLHIVTPSNWLAGCVKSGSLVKERPLTIIPNGLDTNLFIPTDKNKARVHFQLPLEKKIILFGGIRGVEYPLKGFHLLLEAFNKLRDYNYELVVFGSDKPKHFEPINGKVHFLGHISDEKELATLYSASDLVAVPSYQEVFGQTASEALSCGIPVAAFATTGLLDIVDHKTNGYLAKPFDTADLAEGVNWILGNRDRYIDLSRAARLKAETKFDIRIVARRYMELYEEVLRKKP